MFLKVSQVPFDGAHPVLSFIAMHHPVNLLHRQKGGIVFLLQRVARLRGGESTSGMLLVSTIRGKAEPLVKDVEK